MRDEEKSREQLLADLHSLRRRVEELEEERLRTAMDAGRQGWSDFNIQTGEVIVSPEYARMIGYEPAEFTTNLRDWFASIHPEDRSALRKAFQECLETGETRNMEYRRRAKTGRWKWIRSVGKVISFDAHNRPLRIIGAHADISEIKQAEAALRESEELYRTLVEASPDAITVTDTHGTLIFSSNKARQLFGHTTDEDLAGRSILEWVAPEQRRSASQDTALLFTEGTLTGREYTLMRKDGALFWGEINAAVFSSPDGAPRGIMFVTRDITEAKRIRDALKESEAKFRSYIESAPLAVFVADNEGALVDFNPTALNMLGYSPDVLRTLHILDLHPEEDRAEVSKTFSTLMETGHVETEFRLKKSNGDVIWVSLHATKPADRFILGYCQDITERKQAEKRLNEREKLFSTIVGQAIDAVVLIDPKGRFVEFNEAAHEGLGYSREEFALLTLADILPQYSPELMRENRKKILTLGGLAFETTHRHSNGEIRDARVRIKPLSIGDSTYFASVWTDITEQKRAERVLKESEEMFRGLFENTSDAILIIREDRVLDCNSRTLQMYGCSYRHQILGRSLYEFSSPAQPNGQDSKTFTSQKIEAAFNGAPQFFECVCSRLDGTTFPAEVSLNAVQLADRKLVQAIVRDVTERKRAEDALRDSLEEKVALLKEVHHRVKNNLQIVASLLDLQANRTENGQVVDVLQDTRNRVKSMALLHETLYRSGNLARINFATYLKDLGGQLLQSFAHVAGRITLEYDVATLTLPLEQAIPCGLIVGELVSNALKHAFPDGRTGVIVIGFQPPAPGTLVLTVRDGGIGFPPGFDPLSTSTLGLKLVYGLADQLNGHLEIEPTCPGASFRLEFPAPCDTSFKGAEN
jgi:PAS domain S-box-containing protein